jgi:hypothetical protein
MGRYPRMARGCRRLGIVHHAACSSNRRASGRPGPATHPHLGKWSRTVSVGLRIVCINAHRSSSLARSNLSCQHEHCYEQWIHRQGAPVERTQEFRKDFAKITQALCANLVLSATATDPLGKGMT